MVPEEHWAAILISASLIEPDLQVAFDDYGFVCSATRITCCVLTRSESFVAICGILLHWCL